MHGLGLTLEKTLINPEPLFDLDYLDDGSIDLCIDLTNYCDSVYLEISGEEIIIEDELECFNVPCGESYHFEYEYCDSTVIFEEDCAFGLEIIELNACEGLLHIAFNCDNSDEIFEIVNAEIVDGGNSSSPVDFYFNNDTLVFDFSGEYLIYELNFEVECSNGSKEIEIEIPVCDDCCPEGTAYDGSNCYTGIHFPSHLVGFIYQDGFWTGTDCSSYPTTNCCPPPSTFSGGRCYWGPVPSGYDGFVLGSAFYTHISDEYELCCPPLATLHADSCVFAFDINGVSIWANNITGTFHSSRNLSLYRHNNGCPPYSTYNPITGFCDFIFEYDPRLFYGESTGGDLYTTSVPCFEIEDPPLFTMPDNIIQTREPIAGSINVLNNIKVFPNPFSDKFEIEVLRAWEKATFNMYSSVGENVYNNIFFNDGSKIIVSCSLPPGMYICEVKLGMETYSFKILRM